MCNLGTHFYFITIMKKLVLSLALLVSLKSIAQIVVPEAPNLKPFVEVTGTSETEVTPDEIFICITLQERAENKEKLTIEKQEDNLKAAIKELGIDMANLTLNNANSDYRKVKTLGKDVIVSKSYTLKIGNAEMLTKVYEKLDKINAHDAYISKLSHTKILEYQKENRIKAIKAAKEKVEYILAAVGKQAGNPMQISEADNSVQNNVYNYGRYYRGGYASNVAQSYSNESLGGAENNSDISIKKIKVTSSFLVKYEIK